MGRPRKKVDVQELLVNAAKGYTMPELGALMGVSEDTLQRRFAVVIQRGRKLRDASLRKRQFDVAMGGNPSMLIWLGKQYLEQSDKNDIKAVVTHEYFDASSLTDEQLADAERLVESARTGSDT